MIKIDEAKLRETLDKCFALANDRSTTASERAAASKKAAKIQARLKRFGTAPANYQELVRQGKIAMQDESNAQWRLGELADKAINPQYGDRTLEKYAKDIGINPGTLINYRSTYRAWAGQKHRPGVFCVARALNPIANKDPDRVQKLISLDPNITEDEASDETKAFKQELKRAKEKEKAEKEKAKKSKANGKDKDPEPPPPPPRRRSKVPKYVAELDKMLKDNGTLQLNISNLELYDGGERDSLLSSLEQLKIRVELMVEEISKKSLTIHKQRST
jgi:hypothetical protein